MVKQNLSILHLEDDPNTSELVREALEAEGLMCSMTNVVSLDDYARALGEGRFDLILADFNRTSPDGRSPLSLAQEICPEIPFISVLLTSGGEPAREEPNAAVIKDNLARLVPAIQRALKETEEKLARKRAQEAVCESEHRYHALFEHMLDGFAFCRMIYEEGRPHDFIYLEVNSAFERLTHLKDVTGKKVSEVIPGIRESDPGLFAIYGRVALTAKPERFEMYVEALSAWFLISVYSPQKDHFVAIFDVITERKMAEQERESTIEFLRFVNENMDTRSLIRAVTTFLQRQSGCEAVGVRLREGEDYPYYEARGFSEEFVQTERSLCARDSADCVIRDKKGDPVLECMCGNVICGRFNPSKSFFTKHGSFWTNSTTELLRNTTDADRQTRTRNRCNGEGYESVALVPLRLGEQRLGLLQLNDRRKGIFSLEKIEHWERLADQLAIALAKLQTEEALRQSEARFSTVFRYSPIGIVLSRLNDGAFLDVNDSFLGVYGYAREELIGHTSLELNMWVSPGDREEMARILRDKGRVLNLEAKFRKKSGEIGDLLISAELVELAGEHCLLGLFSDISDRKRAERELRTAVDQWNNTFDAINDAIAILNEKGTIQRCNNAMIKLVDKYPQDIIGLNYQDVIPADDTCLPPDCPFDRMKNIRRRDSATVRWHSRWYETTADPIIDQSGKFTGGVYVITDVTERRQFEERLSDSESKFRSLAEQSLVGIYIIQDSVFKYINPRFADLFGYPADEIIDHLRHIDLTWPADRHIIEKAASMQTSSELSSSHYEARGMKKSGDVIHTEIFGSRAYYQGRPAIIGVVLDITEKKKLEHQLLQAQKMEAVGQLTSGIAHDFNNILSAIIGYASLLQMKMEAMDPRQPFVQQILAGCDRAASLTRSLLTFSRKQIVNLMPMHLNESIKKVEMLLQRLIGEDIDLRTVLAPGDPIVNADAGQIEQVMMNLATNARDAMQQGGILAIETAMVNAEDTGVLKTGDAQRDYALITVTDTGIGMDERTREKIFEPFFTTKDLGRGTGLGLSMVYGIIRQHDGFIHCYSEPGIGTTFKIYLPILAEAQDNMQPKLGSPVPEELLRGTETILVVEDDRALRKLSTTVLEDLGYTVIEAVDGVDAVEKFRENRERISLVLCDVIMPRMSGERAYEVIRRLSPDVKIVFMSGYPADIIRQKTLVDKEANIILKPVSPALLLRKVREVLDQ